MPERSAPRPHAVLRRARAEACALGSPTVEAEHVLLAISVQKGTRAQQILDAAGLDHDAISAALDREFEESLSAAGVSLSSFDLPARRRRADREPQWGASAKLAIQRAHTASKAGPGRHMEPTHLLVGILRAQGGTVPRALALAGVDRALLTSAAEQALPRGRQA